MQSHLPEYIWSPALRNEAKMHRKTYWVNILRYLSIFCFAGSGFALPVVPNESESLFGMTTPAGSGRHLATPYTIVCKVVNLNDDGVGVDTDDSDGIISGDFRYCANRSVDGPSTIVFEVSGYITLYDVVRFGSYTTIAGQTAPSPGVTIRGNFAGIERSYNDILIQHMRFRHGGNPEWGSADGPGSWDSFVITNKHDPSRGWYVPKNIVIDNCSISWGVDENMESGADDIAIIDSIFSEGLSKNRHPKGEHSKGLHVNAYNFGVAGGYRTAIIRNLFFRNLDRNPWVSSGSAVIANNVVYDFQFGIMSSSADGGEKGQVDVSIVGNYIIETDISKYSMYVRAGASPDGMVYVGPDNYFKGAVQNDPWNTPGFEDRIEGGQPESSVPEGNKAATPADSVWITGLTTLTASDAYDHVLNNVGARPADRDAADTRIIQQLQARSMTSALVDAVDFDVADCTGSSQPLACCTGSGTGACNIVDWPVLAENTRILNIPANFNDIQPSGYTKLEEWLHGFSRVVEGSEMKNGEIPAPTGLRSTN